MHLRLLPVKNIVQKLIVKDKDQETVITSFTKIPLVELLEMVLLLLLQLPQVLVLKLLVLQAVLLAHIVTNSGLMVLKLVRFLKDHVHILIVPEQVKLLKQFHVVTGLHQHY
jgi:hypothetical protein